MGYFAPNGYGLYDMAGNVWEWGNDWWNGVEYTISPYDNPRGVTSACCRVLRGNSWDNFAYFSRCAARHANFPLARPIDVGFRLALDEGIVMSSEPPGESVDARQPHTLDTATPAQGIDQVDIAFNQFMGTLTTADFMVTQVGQDATPPALIGALPLTVDSVRLSLESSIDPQAWTVFEHLGSGTRTCVGFLPGDVDANQVSDTQDADALVQSLNGMAVRADYSIDMDRSEVVTAEDLTPLMNVLNGDGVFNLWDGEALPASPCP